MQKYRQPRCRQGGLGRLQDARSVRFGACFAVGFRARSLSVGQYGNKAPVGLATAVLADVDGEGGMGLPIQIGKAVGDVGGVAEPDDDDRDSQDGLLRSVARRRRPPPPIRGLARDTPFLARANAASVSADGRKMASRFFRARSRSSSLSSVHQDEASIAATTSGGKR